MPAAWTIRGTINLALGQAAPLGSAATFGTLLLSVPTATVVLGANTGAVFGRNSILTAGAILSTGPNTQVSFQSNSTINAFPAGALLFTAVAPNSAIVLYDSVQFLSGIRFNGLYPYALSALGNCTVGTNDNAGNAWQWTTLTIGAGAFLRFDSIGGTIGALVVTGGGGGLLLHETLVSDPGASVWFSPSTATFAFGDSAASPLTTTELAPGATVTLSRVRLNLTNGWNVSVANGVQGLTLFANSEIITRTPLFVSAAHSNVNGRFVIRSADDTQERVSFLALTATQVVYTGVAVGTPAFNASVELDVCVSLPYTAPAWRSFAPGGGRVSYAPPSNCSVTDAYFSCASTPCITSHTAYCNASQNAWTCVCQPVRLIWFSYM